MAATPDLVALERQVAALEARVRRSAYIPRRLTPKQTAASLLQTVSEVLYGGAAGGGKSDWLLAEGLLYVDVPGYQAVLFRDTYVNLEQEDGLIPRSHAWLDGTDAYWRARTRTWHFPSGASLGFGALTNPQDHLNFAGPARQFMGYEEATTIRAKHYTFLRSRLRRPSRGPLSKVPLRYRAGTNPGGRSHKFFKDRFAIDGRMSTLDVIAEDRAYVPARVADNPHLDIDSYIRTLQHLSPVDRARLLDGDWSVSEGGTMFERGWFEVVPKHLVPTDDQFTAVVRRWDLAASVATPEYPDPDWTVGLLAGQTPDGVIWILDVERFRQTSGRVKQSIAGVSSQDRARFGRRYRVGLPQDPGQAGKDQVAEYRTNTLAGYRLHAKPETGSKVTRAVQPANLAEVGNIRLAEGRWVEEFLEEVSAFPEQHHHDDQVDTLSGAVLMLSQPRMLAAR